MGNQEINEAFEALFVVETEEEARQVLAEQGETILDDFVRPSTPSSRRSA